MTGDDVESKRRQHKVTPRDRQVNQLTRGGGGFLQTANPENGPE